MNILTFDVEEWFHIMDHESTESVSSWGNFEVRIKKNMDRIFLALEQNNKKATFFCLGWIAEKYPGIIREISHLGYEVASHSFSHKLIYKQTPEEFENDLKKSIHILEDITGKKVRAYRAPGFSLTPAVTWAFDVLIKNGIEVDCSIFPAKRGHGGFANFGEATPVILECSSGSLKELPINLESLFFKKIIFSGGGYFRVFPYVLIRTLMKQSNYTMTYFHPRDFDPDQPIIKDLNYIRKFKSYYGLRGSFEKLNRLLKDFEFYDLEGALRQISWKDAKRLNSQNYGL